MAVAHDFSTVAADKLVRFARALSARRL